MKIGVGLPITVPGTPGTLLVEWAKRAEDLGFSTLTTIDRIAYPSYESLIALAAAAGATRTIRLMTNILLAPTRNPVLLAKEAASLDQLSGGRFTLGIGVGGRPDDFDLTEQNIHTRGKRLDAALDLMLKVWRGDLIPGSAKPVSPIATHDGRIPILIGGTSQPALDRMARFASGWTAGGGPPERSIPFLDKVRQAWQAAGREGNPRLVALCYSALGPNAKERATRTLIDYYGDWGNGILSFMPDAPQALQDIAGRFQQAGFDELNFSPTIAEMDQLEGLAQAVLNLSS